MFRKWVSPLRLLPLGLLMMALAASLCAPLERRFVYFPTRDILATPGDLGLDFEEVFVPVGKGQRINGWYVPGDSEVTLLWLHGNGGNLGHRVEEIGLLHYRLGLNVFIVDYRGYGRSDGKPSETGMYQDARAALGYLRSREDVDSEKIIYFGRSLGAAVAVELATRHNPYGLVLVAPFASLGHMARLAFPRLPVHWLARHRFDSLERIPKVRSPLLVLHGEQDEVVPLAQGKLLYQRASHPKYFRPLPLARHNDTYEMGGEDYWRSLAEFLESLPATRDRGGP